MKTIKMTKDELSRSITIFCQVFDAIAPDLDTIDGFRGVGLRDYYTNKNCMEMCVDYVHMYAAGKKDDDVFMSELYNRIGYDSVLKQLCKAYSFV
jgi:hypothetical protein